MLINYTCQRCSEQVAMARYTNEKKKQSYEFHIHETYVSVQGPSSNKKKLGLVLKTRYSLSGRDLQRELT
jgi:hypothetical protein